MFHPSKYNNDKPSTEEEGSKKFKYICNAY